MAIFKVKRKDYDANEDYSLKMQDAVSRGDTKAAGEYEALRNRKIIGEGLNYQPTYDYMDIGNEINYQMSKGASPQVIGGLLSARDKKTRNSSEYSPYFNDDIQRQGYRYYYNSLNGVGGNYENRPEYTDKYGAHIDKLVNNILNKKDFSYDLESDPSYQAYKAQALREGQKAMQNVLAEQSQYAGGNNSYAVSAASQAQNNYLSKLNDVVPALYENAYGRYMTDIQNDRNNLNTLLGAQNNDFNKYLNEYDLWDTDRRWANDAYLQDYEERNSELDKQRAYAQALIKMGLQNGIAPKQEMLTAASYGDNVDMFASIAANNKRNIDNEFESQELSLAADRMSNYAKAMELGLVYGQLPDFGAGLNFGNYNINPYGGYTASAEGGDNIPAISEANIVNPNEIYPSDGFSENWMNDYIQTAILNAQSQHPTGSVLDNVDWDKYMVHGPYVNSDGSKNPIPGYSYILPQKKEEPAAVTTTPKRAGKDGNVIKNENDEVNFNGVDTNSVLSLGLGAIDAKTLEKLVEDGAVELYEKNGKIYAKKKDKHSLESVVNGEMFKRGV